MNALFVHDHRFVLCNGEAYSDKLSVNSFARYLEHFEKITILSRFKNVSSVDKGLSRVTSEKVEFIPFSDLSNIKNKFLFRSKHIKKIKEIIASHDAFILRVPSEISFLVANIARQEGRPYVCEVVACPFDAMIARKTIAGRLYSKLVAFEMRECVANAAAALYVTDEFLQSRYPTSSYQAVASNVEIEGVVLRSRLFDITKKRIISLALVGNLDSPHKGYETAYDFYRKLQLRFPDKKFILHLIGGGSRYKVASSGDDIIYHGSLRKENILKILDGIDLYVQPSTQEGLPRATIEAMSRGVPCVVSDVGGLPEIIEKAYVHPSGDSDAMLDCASKLLSDNARYWEVSERNSTFSRRFLSSSLRSIRFEFFSFYKGLLLGSVDVRIK
jgi:glycosyltransferase involved in cell wall biosynthesis